MDDSVKKFDLRINEDIKSWSVDGFIYSFNENWSPNDSEYYFTNIDEVKISDPGDFRYLTEYSYIDRNMDELHININKDLAKDFNKHTFEYCKLATVCKVDNSDIGSGYSVIKVIFPYELILRNPDVDNNKFYIHGYTRDSHNTVIIKYTIIITLQQNEKNYVYSDYVFTLVDINDPTVCIDNVFIDIHTNGFSYDHDSQISKLVSDLKPNSLLNREFFDSHLNRNNCVVIGNNISDIDGSLYYIGDPLTLKR